MLTGIDASSFGMSARGHGRLASRLVPVVMHESIIGLRGGFDPRISEHGGRFLPNLSCIAVLVLCMVF